MTYKLSAIAAAAVLAGTSQLACAAAPANPVAGVPVVGSLLGGLLGAGLPGLSTGGAGGVPSLPALPAGIVTGPLAGIPVVGGLLATGITNGAGSIDAVVPLVLSVATNLPGLATSVAGLLTSPPALPALSPATLTSLPNQLGLAGTNLAQAFNSVLTTYGLPNLPTDTFTPGQIKVTVLPSPLPTLLSITINYAGANSPGITVAGLPSGPLTLPPAGGAGLPALPAPL
ncbi:MAG: hypothetical protein ACRETW_09150 [Stenotrophobium sp.]